MASYDDVVYWSIPELQAIPASADIIAIGDSWCWYPFVGGSLINCIGDLVKPKGHRILVAGNNGAEAYDYVKGKYKKQCNELLKLYGGSAQALIISGGGNDFAGFNDLRPLLQFDCTNATSAADCYRLGDEDEVGTVNWLMARTFENYSILISRALSRMPATSPIFVHNYDYAIPNGAAALGTNWLKPALDDAKVPDNLQQACVNYLIDGQTVLLQRLADALPGRIIFVDSRNTLSPGDWANELHPTPKGFAKIANIKWKPHLKAAGLI